MRIALVGTRGVPARYGGFETCVEEVGARLADRGHDVLVYTRRSGDPADRRSNYRGMRLSHLPAVRHKALETLSHTALSVAHLVTQRVDAAIVFNAANALFLPLLRIRRIPVATHVDGLEWKRAKWGGAGRRYYRVAEAMAVRWSDNLIADAVGIQDYYREEFNAGSDYIAYGAPLLDDIGHHKLSDLNVEPGGYHLVVARFEPENHVDVAVDGYVRANAKRPLLVVGSAPYGAEHTARIQQLAAGNENVRFLGAVWDQEQLDQLYAGAYTYLHGHSVGGTNPSLLRAMGAGAPTIAFDVRFNREVLGEPGRYFADALALAKLITEAESDPDGTAERGLATRAGASRYDWDDVADKYELLCQGLATGKRQPRASGRRSAAYRVPVRPTGIPSTGTEE
jgi:glycosyltransferase involved in cell wall biosynthesis